MLIQHVPKFCMIPMINGDNCHKHSGLLLQWHRIWATHKSDWMRRRLDANITIESLVYFTYDIAYTWIYICHTLKFVFHHLPTTLLYYNSIYEIVWRWPQKMVETCRGYLHIWASEVRWKQTELCMSVTWKMYNIQFV